MFRNKNKGFSLVELIVVIAILAVFAAVLIPSLLQYTENSRAQKDESAMDEVVNAVQLAMADQDCFDEMLQYSCTNNYLTYSDSSGIYGQQINDGEFWAPDGAGRATTITFNPNTKDDGSSYWKLDEAIVNDMTYGNGSIAQNRVMEGALIENNQCYLKNTKLGTNTNGLLYNRLRQTVGEAVESHSETYQHSSFTVFIRFTQKDGITVADVYGQYNGTNLYQDAAAAKGSGTSEYDVETGDAIVTITTPGTQSSIYYASDLSGGGTFGNAADYKQTISLEMLEQEHTFGYYSTLEAAFEAVRTNSVGISADCEKETAAAGVFVDFNGYPTIMLLKDVELHSVSSNITASSTTYANVLYTNKSTTLNLNGNKLSLYGEVRILNEIGIFTINGETPGSAIYRYGRARIISASDGGLVVNGGTYVAFVDNTRNGNDCIFYCQGNSYIYNAKINVTVDETYQYHYTGVCAYNSENVKIENCEIVTVKKQKNNNSCYSIQLIANKITINDSTITTIVEDDNQAYYNGASAGLVLGGTSIIKNSEIYGTRTGLYIKTKAAIVDGGTYSSSTYGGLYISGENSNVYIKNATLKKCDSKNYGSPLYIGGGSAANNIHVYVDNCEFISEVETVAADAVVLKTDQGNVNNNIYLSRTTFTGTKWIRMDTEDARVTIGQGCNFTKATAEIPDNVTETNEIYD